MVDSTSGGYQPQELSYTSEDCPNCVISAGDELVIAGFNSGDIRWWDISSFPLATTEPCGAISLEHPCDSDIHSLFVSPLYSFLAAVCSYDSKRTSRVRREPVVAILRRKDSFKVHGALNAGFEPPHVFLLGHAGAVHATCFSPCERYIATASGDRTIKLWRTRDGVLLWTSGRHNAWVTRFVFSLNGRVLYVGDEEGEVRMHYLPMFVRDL